MLVTMTLDAVHADGRALVLETPELLELPLVCRD
jgi:hypothetical protein